MIWPTVAPNLVASPIQPKQGARLAPSPVLPRYIFLGPRGGGDPIRIGVFAGIHGDEPAGAYAIVSLIQRLVREPELATGYELCLYPVCNPSGFIDGTRHSRSGEDLNREFWRSSIEPEVLLLEQEILTHSFQGLASLHADDTSHGVYGFLRGAVLTRGLLEPALGAAERYLARNTDCVIDGFAAENGIISECYDGILTAPPELHPTPFEIILETPQATPLELQRSALVAALETILREYSKLLSFAANL